MKNLLVVFAASSLLACSPNHGEVVIISNIMNDLSTENVEDGSVSIEGEEFDLLVVFGDLNKSTSSWSSRLRVPAEEKEKLWAEFQAEVRGELENRFGVIMLGSDLKQDDFVGALKATLELSGFRQQYVSNFGRGRGEGEQHAEEGRKWNSQHWHQRTAIFNR